MPLVQTPMRWPAVWSDPTLIHLLRDSAINCLLVPSKLRSALEPAAANAGIRLHNADDAPQDIHIAKGVWAGVRNTRGGGDSGDAGPTGAPWIDANGWLVQLERARNNASIWIDADPPETVSRWFNLDLPFNDSAAYGARWIITLPGSYAEALARKEANAVQVWDRLRAATLFFAAHENWRDYTPVAALGVVSSFSGDNEMMGTEVLNLTSRLHQPFRVIPTGRFKPESLAGLRAAVYTDQGEPPGQIRSALARFAEQGGLVVAGTKWNGLALKPAPQSGEGDGTLAAYHQFILGKGRVAVPKEEWTDPYLVSSEVKILMGGRSDLVRCWNAGAMNSYLTRSTQNHTVLHLVNYTSHGGRYAPAAHIAGKYTTARVWTIGAKEPVPAKLKPSAGGVEIDLPQVPNYAAIELS